MSLEIILSIFEDIKEAIELINQRAEDVNYPSDFLKDNDGMMKLDSISMRLQVIGESLKKVDKWDKNFLNKYPEIEWEKIKRMRDFISHNYNELDEVEVFTACKFDIPKLEITTDKIIKDINDSGII